VTLVKRPFAETFTFARTVPADHRNALGVQVTALVNQPRFDHDIDGNPRGLMVRMGNNYGEHDAIATVSGWDAGNAKYMVLHEYSQNDVMRRVAFYTTNGKALVDSCLRAAVDHREVIVLDGWKRNRGGYVRFDGRNWSLGDALAVADGPLASPVLADGEDRPFIEG
jgi:hypothetical protein